QDILSWMDPLHVPVALLAMMVRTARALGNGSRRSASREIRRAYAEHGAGERYLHWPDVRREIPRALPGAHIRPHLLWRYSVVWRKQ
ncbi:MAG TPA: hypothetical protein VFX98_04205, partial [Longimicrobiaceae bacterium]|nr:hypothetical protein [Longimicrobiaceae bacterium]